MPDRSCLGNIKPYARQSKNLVHRTTKMAWTCCVWLVLASIVSAQNVTNSAVVTSSPETSGRTASQNPQDKELNEKTLQIRWTPKLDLGSFEIQNLEPARALTSKITFELHLTLPEETSPADLATLEHWQHRLREQVIVAVRVSDIVDFLDPKLDRFRRHILYRVNRLLGQIKAQEVLLADFTFSAG